MFDLPDPSYSHRYKEKYQDDKYYYRYMVFHPYLTILLVSLRVVVIVIFNFEIFHRLVVLLLPEKGPSDTDVGKVVVAV